MNDLHHLRKMVMIELIDLLRDPALLIECQWFDSARRFSSTTAATTSSTSTSTSTSATSGRCFFALWGRKRTGCCGWCNLGKTRHFLLDLHHHLLELFETISHISSCFTHGVDSTGGFLRFSGRGSAFLTGGELFRTTRLLLLLLDGLLFTTGAFTLLSLGNFDVFQVKHLFFKNVRHHGDVGTRRIIAMAVAKYQSHFIFKLVSVHIFSSLELLEHCTKVHGLLDHIKVVRNVQLDWIHWDVEWPCVLVLHYFEQCTFALTHYRSKFGWSSVTTWSLCRSFGTLFSRCT
mmetsp:Transcript_2609/g.3805  ORF Transcript_2609/g.3805 Transcript_2609/m.3805 type:complete len:290 (-) Transcript_2609:385-1254(-)